MIIWKLKYIIIFSVIFLHLVVFICWQVARQIESLSGQEGDSKFCHLIITLLFLFTNEKSDNQWSTDNRGTTKDILFRYYHWILGNSIIISLLMSVVYIYFFTLYFSISLIIYLFCVKHVNLLNNFLKQVS